MPHVLDVPMFTGIRMHSGTTEQDTDGCILVALRHKENRLTDSKLAFNALFTILSAVQDRGEEMWIMAYSESEMQTSELNLAT